MGLSSKQVSNDFQAWSGHHPQRQATPGVGGGGSTSSELPKPKPHNMKRQLHESNNQSADNQSKCPRCGSGNTKFCYYNNYNKSQPRHFCKACKRHWTKGGTLRNVPVGGGKKNKRIKMTASSLLSSSAAAAPPPSKLLGLGLGLGLGFTDKKITTDHSPSSLLINPQHDQYNLSSHMDHIFDSSLNNITTTSFLGKDPSDKVSSSDHHHHHHLPHQINHLLDFGGSTSTFPYQTLLMSSNPSPLEEGFSIFNSSYSNTLNSFQPMPSLYGCTSDQSTSLELEGTISYATGGGTTTTNTTNSINDQSWKSNLPQQQGWEDEIDKFVSSDEIAVSWDIDDSEITLRTV